VCAIGALYRFGLPITWLLDSGEDMTWAKYLMGRLACFSSMMYECPSIILVNDELGREQVIDVFDTYLAWREDHEPDDLPQGWNEFTNRTAPIF
jgi:hypothetical protein